MRTFPVDWPSADSKRGIREDRLPTNYARPKSQPQTSILYQSRAGNSIQNPCAILSSQHQQHDFKSTQSGCARQASVTVFDSLHQQNCLQHQEHGSVPHLPSVVGFDTYDQERICQCHASGPIPQALPKDFDSQYQLGESFPDSSQNPIGIENVEDTGCLEGGYPQSFDDQQVNGRENELARQPDRAFHHQLSNPLQHDNRQTVQQLHREPLSIGPQHYQTFLTPNAQQPDCLFEGQNGTSYSSAKHYCNNPIFDNHNPAPQYPLPPLPTMNSGVIHKGYNQTSWCPIGVKGSSITKVDPDGFPTNHRRKRLRGQSGREFRDSIALWQLQHNSSNLAAQESHTSQATQPDTTQNPTAIHHDRPRKVSVQSDLRDSGYASIFDSAVDTMRSSISSLNLADDVNFKTDYEEADDGYVEVKLNAQWRMRRSYLEKLRDAPLSGLSSESAAASD
jgi:hypothetical protein